MRILFPDGEKEVHPLSKQIFSNVPFVDIPDGALIYNSDFSQSVPDVHIFRPAMRNVIFRNCNLTNVFIPPNNTLIDCQTIRVMVQNDLNDWEVDMANRPVRPVEHLFYTKYNLPMPSPADIPAQKVAKRIDLIRVSKDEVGRP